jgi:hypothetical protein
MEGATAASWMLTERRAPEHVRVQRVGGCAGAGSRAGAGGAVGGETAHDPPPARQMRVWTALAACGATAGAAVTRAPDSATTPIATAGRSSVA